MKTNPVRDIADKRLRKSACANRSRAGQLLRIERMSVEERIKAALSMSRRYAWLQPVPGGH